MYNPEMAGEPPLHLLGAGDNLFRDFLGNTSASYEHVLCKDASCLTFKRNGSRVVSLG
jgi:hypothetical protein